MANIVPLYQSMLNDLIRQIESGELPEDSKLPSEQKLGEIYHVSRITVRRALTELENKQYISKKQGQGSFVLRREDENLGVRYLNVRQIIEQTEAIAKMKLLSYQLLVNEELPDMREKLDLTSDDYMYAIENMFYADDHPVFHQKIYLPYERFPSIYHSELANNGDVIPFLIKKYNLDVQFFTHSKAGLISKKNRKLFNLNVGDPLVDVYTHGIEQRKVVYYSEATVVGNLIMYITG
ncbi:MULTISPECIES: GntR family transcriptional regulator [unclassified Sporolactobacillus]|uniref:GntR family transcriptional regulator n=1 Tax=unclassified Sporolactobacillus TaxID=2628533 RepID=UPI002368C291|nr:GntR family transcriptional regulator [Sporolactobacillus sp. CQH2019]MDD9147922.1 GntR family transcriptional regulator [Sporolactobacillus sp. CQH2019]